MKTVATIRSVDGRILDTDLAVKERPLWRHIQGLQETASGYGSRLTTPYVVHYLGRWRRVYATCYSNTASHWVKIKGEQFFLTIYED